MTLLIFKVWSFVDPIYDTRKEKEMFGTRGIFVSRNWKLIL